MMISTTTNTMIITMMKTVNIFRTCACSNKKYLKEELFRIVKINNKEVKIEKDEHLFGRGAYLYKDQEIILKAKKRKCLSRALRIEVKDEIYDELIALLESEVNDHGKEKQ